MSEKLVVGIQHMDINAATYHKVPMDLTYVNYFFGNNGVGKTTIAREIAKLKRPANEISGGEEPAGVVFEPGKAHRDYNILVYNQDFIRDNFRQLENLPGVFMVDEESIKQEDDLNAAKAEKEETDKAYGELVKQMNYKKSAITTMGTTLENDCWNLTKTLRDRFPEVLMSGTKTKKGFLDKIKSVAQPVEHDEQELAALYDTAFDKNARTYNLFTSPSSSSMDILDGLQLLGERIVSSSDTDFARFIKAINATDWVRQGHERFHDTSDGKCPYCQQMLPISFEEELAACFDHKYQQEVNAITDLLQAYKTAGNNLWSILQNNLQDMYSKIDVTEYRDKMTILKNAIAGNIQKIDQKIKEPSNEVVLEPIAPLIEELNGIIAGFNNIIKSHNDIVNAAKTKKKECTEKAWELMAWKVKDVIQKYNADFATATSDYGLLESDAKKKQTYSLSLAEKIADLNKHSVNTEEAIANMNKMLRDSGFQGFSIQEHPIAKNQYQIVREDGTVAELLSEGERNFIAFLYFCNLVHGNGCTRDREVMINTEGKEEVLTDGRDMRDKIVVIDDPVSSMDSSALFIVSSLVRSMIAICRNNITLGEKVEKGDYIKQMFILTHNAYFHREVTVGQEKNYASVSFFLITKNDNKSTIKLCVTKNEEIPTEKRNYNPVQNSYAALWTEYNEVKSSITLKNVIRRILEYYFIQICGYDGHTLQDIILRKNRDKFVKVDETTGEEDTSELRTVASMIDYLTASNFGVNEGLHFIEDSTAPEIYKDLTKRIFEAMGQPQHYDMMSSIFIS